MLGKKIFGSQFCLWFVFCASQLFQLKLYLPPWIYQGVWIIIIIILIFRPGEKDGW